MIGKATLGRGFRGVMLYVLHDKGHAATTERVADIEFLNLRTADPESAARIMAATAAKSRCKKPVYHLSISWHAEDEKGLSHAVMLAQVKELLAGLGLDEHQAVIVWHTDKAYPHCHVVLNRVHPETLKAAQLSFDHCRIVTLCRDLELKYGLTVAPLDRRALRDHAHTFVDELTHNQATFTEAQLYARIQKRAQDSREILDLIDEALKREDVMLAGTDTYDQKRYTTRAYEARERQLFLDAETLSSRNTVTVNKARLEDSLKASRLTEEQQQAVRDILDGADLSCLVGRAGAGKTTALKEVVAELEASGYRVIGAAPTGAAAKALSQEAGIQAKTLHAWKRSWETERNPAGNTVIVVDEAGMVSTRLMASTLAHAEKTGAKVVLVGDPDQLKAIEAGDAYRGIAERFGYTEIGSIRRQNQQWAREASEHLAQGRIEQGLSAYEKRGFVQWQDRRSDSVKRILQDYLEDRDAHPDKSRLILSYERESVTALNTQIRDALKERATLGPGHVLDTADGKKEFAADDRVLFGKNDYGEDLSVRNGSMGTVRLVTDKKLSILLDGSENRTVTFSMERYADVSHAYAVTIHKSQGATVDQTYVLTSKYLHRNAAYVAMTRHRDDCRIYADKETLTKGKEELVQVMSRPSPKDLIRDYALSLSNAPENELASIYRQARQFENAAKSLKAKKETWRVLEARKEQAETLMQDLRERLSPIYKKPEAALTRLIYYGQEVGSRKTGHELADRPDKFGPVRGLPFTKERREAIEQAALLPLHVSNTLEARRLAVTSEQQRQRAQATYEQAPEQKTLDSIPAHVQDKPRRLQTIRQLEQQIQAKEDKAARQAPPELKEVHQYKRFARALDLAKEEGNALAVTWARTQMEQQATKLAELAEQSSSIKETLEQEGLSRIIGYQAERVEQVKRPPQRGMER